MKLAHSIFDTPIEFEENRINVLVIENKKAFTSTVLELIAQADGADGGFVLSDKGKELSFGGVDIVSDVFRLEVNNRKNIGRLVAVLEQTAVSEGFYEESCRISGEIFSYASGIVDVLEYNVDISEIKLSDIFKLCNAKFAFESETLCGGILDYLKVSRDIAKMNLFVFVNLKQILDRVELEQLFKSICYNKYNVLLLESSCDFERLPCERYRIIDEDLCEVCT